MLTGLTLGGSSFRKTRATGFDDFAVRSESSAKIGGLRHQRRATYVTAPTITVVNSSMEARCTPSRLKARSHASATAIITSVLHIVGQRARTNAKAESFMSRNGIIKAAGISRTQTRA